MGNNMKIRKATLQDKNNISELYYELHPAKRKMLIPIERSKIKSIIFVAEGKKQIAGFIWANFIQYGFFKYGCVEELFVKKEFRKRGTATFLIRKAMKEFTKLRVKVLFVTTEKKNREAIKLYKKLGFKLSRGPWFYWNPRIN